MLYLGKINNDNSIVNKGYLDTNYQKKLTADNNISIDANTNAILSKPILEVPSLPTGTIDQRYLYKVSGTNAINWWNGSSWIDISAKSGMINVTEFPTGSNINPDLLYKLTEDITHATGDIVYTLEDREFTEGSTTPTPTEEGQYFHNTSNSQWYVSRMVSGSLLFSQISVEAVVNFPTPMSSNVNTYYYNGTDLKQCIGSNVVVVDYYAGVYAYFNGWQPLYTSNVTIDYNSGIREDSLPVIGDVKVKGTHSIADFGGVTQVVADALYQTINIRPEDIPEGYIATTVIGLIKEMASKFSRTIRMAGNTDYYDQLPKNPDSGDLWSLKYKWSSDYLTDYGHERQLYYESVTPTAGKITHNTSTNKWYDGTTEITVQNVVSLPTATSSTVGTWYYCNNILYKDAVGKYIMSTNNWCWNGIQWFLYGSGDIDMSLYEKITDYSNALQVANPTQDMTGSHLKANSVNTYLKVVSTLNTPIIDLSSSDHLVLEVPTSAVTIPDQPCAALNVKTHAGQFTAMENVASLPSSGGSTDYVYSISEDNLLTYYLMRQKSYTSASGHTGTGYEKDISNSKWYYNGTEITVLDPNSLPTPEESLVGNYYLNNNKLYLCEEALGVKQDFNQVTGDLMWEVAGREPSVKNKLNVNCTISSGETKNIYILKTDGNNGFNKIGEVQETSPITQNIPVWEVESVSLTFNTNYVRDCARAESGLNVNVSGVYGHYVINESELSKKYSYHKMNGLGLKNGFDGTVTFVPSINSSEWRRVDKAYWLNNKLYCQGDITIDKIILSETL